MIKFINLITKKNFEINNFICFFNFLGFKHALPFWI